MSEINEPFEPNASNIFAMDQFIDDNRWVVWYPINHAGSVRTLAEARAEHAAMQLARDNWGRVHSVLSA